MSRGELIINDNQVKPASGDSASEFQQQHNADPSWADEYVSSTLIKVNRATCNDLLVCIEDSF